MLGFAVLGVHWALELWGFGSGCGNAFWSRRWLGIRSGAVTNPCFGFRGLGA